MRIKHQKITDKIHLLVFETQRDITSTFLRFQEHYESPKFREKVFTLKEFKSWYIKTSPGGKSSGRFTYYLDWHGFNIPSYILKPFYEGKFNPLSSKEKKILEIFKKESSTFYIIGIHKEIKRNKRVLKHEIAHGLFYTNSRYRKEVLKTLSEFNIGNIKKELGSKAGYHQAVLDDEVHAYGIDSAIDLKTPIPQKLSAKLEKLYKKYLEQN